MCMWQQLKASQLKYMCVRNKSQQKKKCGKLGKKKVWKQFHVWHHTIDASDYSTCGCTSKNHLRECITTRFGMLDLVIPIKTSNHKKYLMFPKICKYM